jgi:hypothetical protein
MLVVPVVEFEPTISGSPNFYEPCGISCYPTPVPLVERRRIELLLISCLKMFNNKDNHIRFVFA